jgi:hypothetical protein
MKLDFAELNKGVEDQLSKSAMMSVGMPAAAPAVSAAAKGAGGFVAKKLPILGGVIHGGFAINDALKGDWTGAAMNAGAGIAGLIPHPVATAAMYGLDAVNAARNLAPAAANMLTNNQQTGVMNTLGKYAPAAMAGLTMLGSKRPQQQMPMYQPIPHPQAILNPSRMDPHSLAAPQMFAEKLAAYINKKATLVDAFAGAAGRKLVDNVLDSAISEKAEPSKSEKEIELVSKHPEIEKMLKNEQTKNYLEKLLQD